MITVQTLINLAPFQEDIKTALLEKVDTFSDEKKLELINICWGLISQWYQNEIQHRHNLALLEIAEGKKTYTEEELEKISKDVLNEMMGKLQEAATEEDIEDVREKLEDLTEKIQQQ